MGLIARRVDAAIRDHDRVESILETIGNTPLVRVHRSAPANGAELWLKLEYRNPTGSMKDRMALAMIEGAERDGLISAGDTVVEYTGGSTGPALALVCRAKGYRALIVMADCFTEERFQLMRALGAEIDVVPSVEGRPKVTAKDIENMVARAAELGPFLVQGWTGLVMPHWDPGRVDHLEPIEDEEAIEMTLRLSREEGIFAGISTGANVVGAHRLAERLGPDAVIVTLAVDTGFKYMSVAPYG